MLSPSLSISCVYYDTAESVFIDTISSLLTALDYCKAKKPEFSYHLYILNNNPANQTVFSKAVNHLTKLNAHFSAFNEQGNIGYGRANNIAINQTNASYHLVLNPDVIVAENALLEALTHFEINADVAMIAPNAKNQIGDTEYLAKRRPSLGIILLRGLNKPFLNSFFQKKLNDYIYKNELPTEGTKEIEIASGCFMFCRTHLLKQVGGFTEDFFLYFEDFDLSLKMRKLGKIHYCSNVRIIHFGGNTARKGAAHIKLFLKSFFIFEKLNPRK